MTTSRNENLALGSPAASRKARERYYADPSYCKHCGKMIPIKDGQRPYEAKHKTFCNHSCAASYNNLGCSRRTKRVIHPCAECGNPTTNDTYCSADCSREAHTTLDVMTRGELLQRYGWRRTRSVIQTRARAAFKRTGKEYVCSCGYARHVEVCHIRAVADFPPETQLQEINAASNLTVMCRNCHWEHDHQQ